MHDTNTTAAVPESLGTVSGSDFYDTCAKQSVCNSESRLTFRHVAEQRIHEARLFANDLEALLAVLPLRLPYDADEMLKYLLDKD